MSQRSTPHSYPVSIKGVVVVGSEILLLRNERDEWELPGGRLEADESPEECVAREVREETGLTVRTGPILDSWLYYVAAAHKQVFVVTYGCEPIGAAVPLAGPEHREVALFTRGQVEWLTMPVGYLRSIMRWMDRLG